LSKLSESENHPIDVYQKSHGDIRGFFE